MFLKCIGTRYQQIKKSYWTLVGIDSVVANNHFDRMHCPALVSGKQSALRVFLYIACRYVLLCMSRLVWWHVYWGIRLLLHLVIRLLLHLVQRIALRLSTNARDFTYLSVKYSLRIWTTNQTSSPKYASSMYHVYRLLSKWGVIDLFVNVLYHSVSSLVQSVVCILSH